MDCFVVFYGYGVEYIHRVANRTQEGVFTYHWSDGVVRSQLCEEGYFNNPVVRPDHSLILIVFLVYF